MFCRKCGKESATGEKFCSCCGSALAVPGEKTKNENTWFANAANLAEEPSTQKELKQDLCTSSTKHTGKFYTPGDLEQKTTSVFTWEKENRSAWFKRANNLIEEPSTQKKTDQDLPASSAKPTSKSYTSENLNHKKHSDRTRENHFKHSNKKMWMILVGAACCVFVLVTVLAVLKKDAGLSKKEAQEQLDIMLEAVYEGSSPDNFIMETLNGNVDVCVDRIYAQNDSYIAECTVSVPDVATSISDYLNTLPENETALYTDIVSELKDHIQTAPIITKTFDVRFVNKQGDWQPIVHEEMVIFCCGNIHELLPLIYSILGGSGE